MSLSFTASIQVLLIRCAIISLHDNLKYRSRKWREGCQVVLVWRKDSCKCQISLPTLHTSVYLHNQPTTLAASYDFQQSVYLLLA